MRGRMAASCSNCWSKVMMPNMSWKNTADMPMVPIVRAIAAAIGMPSMPQRVDSDESATATTVAVLRCSKSRTTIGLKFVSVDCGQSMFDMRSPGCQSRRPTKSNPEPVKRLRCSPIVNSRMRRMIRSSISVSSDRLTNGSTSCSRVLTVTVRSSQCHDAIASTEYIHLQRRARSWNRDALEHVGEHRIGVEAVARRVGAEPEPMPEHVGGELLDVVRVDFRALADEERPHLRQTPPAD